MIESQWPYGTGERAPTRIGCARPVLSIVGFVAALIVAAWWWFR